MTSFVFGFSLFALVFAVLAVHEEFKKIESEKNIARSGEFECRQPQPRSFLYSDLMEDKERAKLIPEYKIFPPSAVLHRCENAGCCEANKSCSESEGTFVTLYFQIIGGNSDFLELSVRNSTKCSCQRRKNSPK